MPSDAPARLAVAGATGRMGRLIARHAGESGDFRVAVALVAEDEKERGGTLDQVTGNPADAAVPVRALGDGDLAEIDVMVDFTAPDASAAHAQAAAKGRFALVIGTTGLGPTHHQAIREASGHTPVLVAPNTSIGVNLLRRLAAEAAAALGAAEFDAEIVEAHHRGKADAPSGTALALGEAVAAARGQDLGECAAYARTPDRPGRRADGEIGFASIRGGGVFGEHTVMLVSRDERVELTHRAMSRDVFALGALRAARFVRSAAPGLYGMQHVLGAAPG